MNLLTTMTYRILLSILVCALFAACDSSTPVEDDGPPDLTDTWTSTFEDEQGDEFDLTLQLQTTATEVAGGGTFDGPDEVSDFSIAGGAYNFPTLELQLSITGSRPGTLTGTVSEDGSQIDATISGTDIGSFSNTPLVLTR